MERNPPLPKRRVTPDRAAPCADPFGSNPSYKMIVGTPHDPADVNDRESRCGLQWSGSRIT